MRAGAAASSGAHCGTFRACMHAPARLRSSAPWSGAGFAWLLAVVSVCSLPSHVNANECPNEPPLVGAHYMSNWHTGRWSQWKRCAQDGANIFEIYPERAPTTGLFHDMAAYYEFNGQGPSYPNCPDVWNVLDCNAGQTNRPCCDQYKCYLEANNHMKCMGGASAFDFTRLRCSPSVRR